MRWSFLIGLMSRVSKNLHDFNCSITAIIIIIAWSRCVVRTMTCQLVNFCFQVYNLAKGAFITIDQYLSSSTIERENTFEERKESCRRRKERKKEISFTWRRKKNQQSFLDFVSKWNLFWNREVKIAAKMSSRDYGGNRYDNRGGGRYGNLQTYDYANWGYIILYLVIEMFLESWNSLFKVARTKRAGYTSFKIWLAVF